MDKMILAGCVGLFLVGALFGIGASSGIEIERLKVVDIFAIVSTIATALAAYAAWRAAATASKQSADNAVSLRWQMYKMHRESFDDLLDNVESNLKVNFYSRHETYDAIFPNNRNVNLPFTSVGGSELESWQRSYTKLADACCRFESAGQREIERWIGDYLWLAGCMRYSTIKADEPQVRMGGWVPSGVSAENHEKIASMMWSVLHSLSKFSYMENNIGYRGMSAEFKADFQSFLRDAEIGRIEHCYK
ncbi:hypothetical protein [Pseudomonas qingdaonensis]|uniref:hypothetical protein n=1 Tax=Pseudomonas qingdaonensis TaxID=2056231 RepID=UPI0033400094